MFKHTQSITASREGYNSKKDEHSAGPIDLFDLLHQEQSDEEDIQTFDQLKQWVNTYPFVNNEKSIQINRNMMKPKINSNKSPQVGGLSKKVSLDIDYSPIDRNFGYQATGTNFLDIIKEKREIPSRKVARKQSQTLAVQIDSPYVSKEQVRRSNEENKDNQSINKSSARSSRSCVGYDLINQYEIREKLGSGAFSTVFLARDIHTEKQYAVKILEKKSFRKKLFRKNSVSLAENYMQNEVAILKKMDHPYVIKLHEVIEDEEKQKTYLILDYCSNGYINQGKLFKDKKQTQRYQKLLESQCRRYFKQFTLGLHYIHQIANIAHRDIKPENILLSDRGEVKISDFGLGTEEIQTSSKSGTRNFMPPEILNKNQSLNQKGNIQKADVWASGITLLIMLTGKNIDMEPVQLEKYILNLNQISQQCRDFLKKCLNIDPQKRLNAVEMLAHPWINSKQSVHYQQIKVSKEDQEQAINKLNKDILKAITKLQL